MNQNEREGQSSGRTTGASGNQAEQQQNRTIEGQESDPGKVWQESDTSQYGGQGQTGGQGKSGDASGKAGLRGGFDQTRDQGSSTNAGYGSGSGSSDDRPENEPMDESQWQGDRFSQGGSSSNQGGSNG